MEELLKPKGIAKLVACTPKELKQVSTKLKIPLTTATGLRRLWLRKFSGKCVLCGHKSERGDLCPSCKPTTKTKLLDSRRPRTLLKQIPAATVLLKYDCACGGTITMTAGEILKQFLRRGTLYRVKGLCRKCREKARATSRPPVPKQTKRLNKEPAPPPITAPVVVPAPTVVETRPPVEVPPEHVRWADMPGEVLTHRPFEALKELKICHA